MYPLIPISSLTHACTCTPTHIRVPHIYLGKCSGFTLPFGAIGRKTLLPKCQTIWIIFRAPRPFINLKFPLYINGYILLSCIIYCVHGNHGIGVHVSKLLYSDCVWHSLEYRLMWCLCINCLQPKLENIPEGDWYCYECISKVSWFCKKKKSNTVSHIANQWYILTKKVSMLHIESNSSVE